MHRTFLVGISGLKISNNLGRGDKLDDKTFITNNKETIRALIPREAITVIGELEMLWILDAGAVIYSLEDMSPHMTDKSAYNKFLAYMMTHAASFLHTLWHTKDHACLLGKGYLFDDQFAVGGCSRGYDFVKATGEQSPTEVSREELGTARSLFRLLTGSGVGYSSKITRIIKESSNRLSRADAHRLAATTSPDVAFKIASYCSALEALFSTSSAELSHQLSERVAFLLEDDPGRRRLLYEDLKRAYTFRSKAVHGDHIKQKDWDGLRGVSVRCDEIVRRVYSKIFASDDLQEILVSSAEDINDFFLDRIVGVTGE